MKPQSRAGGALALLGSEGTGADFAPAWRQILNRIRAVSIVPISFAEPGLMFQTRQEILSAALASLGIHATAVTRANFDAGRAEDTQIKCQALLIVADTPGSMTSDGQPVAEYLARTIGSGGLIIASATAAAALGQVFVAASRPLPPNPIEAELMLLAGMAIFEGVTVLPYFDQLPQSCFEQITRLIGDHALIVGIDHDAALIIDSGGARSVGLGKVTLLRDNEVVWVGTDSETAPAGLIALNHHSDR